jgi:hypothetical protein
MTQDRIAPMRDRSGDRTTPRIERGDDDDPYLILTVEQARILSDRELHQRVRAIVQSLEAAFGRDKLPADLPWRPSSMSREELLAAVQLHASWFDANDMPGLTTPGPRGNPNAL